MWPIKFSLREASRPQPHAANLSWAEGLLHTEHKSPLGWLDHMALSTHHWGQSGQDTGAGGGAESQANHMAEDGEKDDCLKRIGDTSPRKKMNGCWAANADGICRLCICLPFPWLWQVFSCCVSHLWKPVECPEVPSLNLMYSSHCQSSTDSTQGKWQFKSLELIDQNSLLEFHCFLN